MHRKPDHPIEDGLNAATALANRLIVATRNGKDFAGFGVETVDPFGTGATGP
ncbi:MAG: hypothetical protein AB7F96_16705 [Beijerinckiaceae bacterium]